MLFKKFTSTFCEFQILRDTDLCINCKICIGQCPYAAYFWDKARKKVAHDNRKCIGCYRCVAMCPTVALTVKKSDLCFRDNGSWKPDFMKNIYHQAQTVSAFSHMHNSDNQLVYWDQLLLDGNAAVDSACRSIDLNTHLGAKPGLGSDCETNSTASIEINIPLVFADIPFGIINSNVKTAISVSAEELGTICFVDSGNHLKNIGKYSQLDFVQNGPDLYNEYCYSFSKGAGVVIDLTGFAGSIGLNHNIDFVEDLSKFIGKVKQSSEKKVLIAVKIAAGHGVADVASGIVSAGADVLILEGVHYGASSSPAMPGKEMGLPMEIALSCVDQRLRDDDMRSRVSIVAGGYIRCSRDVVKAIALGADAVSIDVAALIAVGCTLCGSCHTGKCAWGISTNDKKLVKRQNPEIAAEQLVNFMRNWSLEITDMLCCMGLDSIESLCGNRSVLRAIRLSEIEMDVLGIKHAGR
ncbi:glutamate synthase-related protein [Maridesulfovibrio zosterae]|uniref:glutamate synthase-related protein n=1 Tax=Maridesulfovibrio zosterae TaxID=82171 RepID=UPI00048322AC|nr:glutamate synthase-related protein [Maridesulfovibrio zosterae]